MHKKCFASALVFILIVLPMVSAAGLSVEKRASPGKIKAGDGVSIMLVFQNPFGVELPIRIVDKSILGENGMDIQCSEQVLPSNEQISLEYGPIIPSQGGIFSLSAAEVTYTNPETGAEETIKSNSLIVEVAEAQAPRVTGITTLYQCNGMNMQSTNYSSSGGQAGSEEQQNEQKQQEMQNRMQNNMMPQNTAALKQEMQEQLEEQRKMEEEFREQLEQNEEFQEKQKELEDQGYEKKGDSLDASNENSGEFEALFENQEGETAAMKGKMENGEMKEIMSQTSEDREKMQQELENNEEFQALKEQLAEEGFEQKETSFNQESESKTKTETSFKNEEGQEKKVTAEHVDENIVNVSLEGEGGGEENWQGMLLLLLLAIGFVAIGFFVYKKYFKKKAFVGAPAPVIEKPIDFTKESLLLLSEAERLFNEGKEKDACEKASQAIRFYFSRKNGMGMETTSAELIDRLRGEKFGKLREVKKCLNLCSMVEFAKHSAREKEFMGTLGIARELIA